MFTIWKRLFNSKMKEGEWGMDTVDLWAIALTDLKITKPEFDLAQRKSLTLEWMPTAPADFIKLSRVDVSANYPDMKAAYQQAAQGSYKHEVILETAKRVGEWELKTQSESVSYKSWQQHYPVVCNEHSQGSSFKVPVSHQVEHKHQPVSNDSPINSQLDDFFAKFGSKTGETV